MKILKQSCPNLLVEAISMNAPRNRTVAETIYDDIEKNDYLIELYNGLLRAYTRKLFDRDNPELDSKKLKDL